MSAPAGQRELVFCHECENEWYRDEHGLSCPACSSDFTEVIERDNDPRVEQASQLQPHPHPLHQHNPWADTPDPDEDDITEMHNMWAPGQYQGSGSNPQHGHGPGNPSAPPPFAHPLFGSFASMFQGMTGMPTGGFSNAHSPHQGARSQERQSSLQSPFSDLHRPQSAAPTMQPSGVTTFTTGPQGTRISFISSGPGFHFSTTTRGGGSGGDGRGGPGNAQGMPIDVNEILGAMFGGGNLGHNNGGATDGHPQHPFAALFNGLLNPANAMGGDAVYSQEAFDRVMSQLMEQHTSGSAPGPASAAAIAALPRRPVDAATLGDSGAAECSICMDAVTLGETVLALPCRHWFHPACAEAWLREHDTCPICRAGIMPKDGPRDVPRQAGQPPLNNQDPFELARQQSGSREHPYIVDESPTAARRRPRRGDRGSGSVGSGDGREASASEGSGGAMGAIAGTVRRLFGGGGAGAGADGDAGAGSSDGHH